MPGWRLTVLWNRSRATHQPAVHLPCGGGWQSLESSIPCQKPDTTGNLLNFTRENPKSTGLIAEDAWRLVRSGDEVRLERNGFRALPLLMDMVALGHGPALREMLKDRVLRGCLERGIPLPQMGVGVEETGAELSDYWLG